MMRWIIALSLRVRFLAVIVAVVLLVFGITQLRSMPLDLYPEFDPPLVEVQTEALGLSAAEVESLITVPLEADLLNGVAWLDRIYSDSVAGLSTILMVFEPGTDPIRARLMVQERLTQAHALPNVSKPPLMLQPLSSNSRVMMVGVSSNDLSLIELGVLARWNIKPRLMGVPGVANVAIWGQRERQLQVQVDPAELHEHGVRLSEVVQTAGEALWVSPLTYLESSKPGTGGWIDTPNQRLGIRHLLPIVSPEELGKVAVANHKDLLLNEVATVVEDHQPLIGDAIVDGAQGLLLVIEKFPAANTLDVTRAVETALAAMRPGLQGVELDSTVFRPANYIEATIGNLANSLLVGGILALLVLLLFLWNWRTALISIVTIPLALITAGMVLYWRGVTLNAMTMAGLMIALGVIIDDVVVDVENIARRLREASANVTAAAVIQAAALEMRGSVVFATLILLLVVLPVFLLQGLTGLFFAPLVNAYVAAVLASLAVSLLITPGFALLLLPNRSTAAGVSPFVRGIQNIYGGLVKWTLRAGSFVTLLVAAVIIVAGLAVLPLLDLSLLPSFRQSDLVIHWDAAPGTSHTAMNRTITQVATELRTIAGVRNVSAHVGRAETGDQTVGVNSANLWVNLDPAADYDQTVAQVNSATAGYPGVFRSVTTYAPERLSAALLGPQADITLRVYGVDFALMREKAAELAERISTINGVASATAETPPERPEVEIEVDLAAAEQNGLKPGDVRRQATTLLSGIQVGSLFEEQKVFDVVVWGKPELRDTLTDIHNLLIDTPDGDQVRLGDVASVRIVPTPITIKRDAVSRYVDVAVILSGRDAAAVTNDIRIVLQGVEFPLEYRAEVLGESLAQQASRQRMIVVAIAALVGIYLLLQAAFGGWRLALVVLVSLLMALAGGVLAAFLNERVLSLGALFGLLAILGIAVRNGLVIVHHFQHLENEGEPFGPELIYHGARDRVGPILTTALVVAGVFLPFALFGNRPGHEILRPMAVVLFGGLLTTTLLNLFVIPVVYLRFRAEPDAEILALDTQAAMGAAD